MNPIDHFLGLLYAVVFLGLCWAAWHHRDKLPWYLKLLLVAFLIIGLFIEGVRMLGYYLFVEPFARRAAARTAGERAVGHAVHSAFDATTNPPVAGEAHAAQEQTQRVVVEPVAPQPERIEPTRVTPEPVAPIRKNGVWDDPGRWN